MVRKCGGSRAGGGVTTALASFLGKVSKAGVLTPANTDLHQFVQVNKQRGQACTKPQKTRHFTRILHTVREWLFCFRKPLLYPLSYRGIRSGGHGRR